VHSYYSERVDDGAALISETDRTRVALGDNEVVVRVYGEELDTLVEQADAIKTHLSELEEVTDIRVELPPVEPNLEVEVDLAAAERHGLLPGDVRRSATTLSTGLTVGSLFEEQKVFDVVVAGRRDYFEDPARIGDLLIDTPNGGTVQLDEVADVRPGTSFSVINRESVSRRLDVALTVSGDRADAAEKVENALEDVEFPLEYHAEVIGAPESALDVGLLLLVAGGALIAMVLLLQAHLRSWTVNAAAVGVIAFSMAGGVLAMALMGGELTIGAVLGLVAVLALGVRNVLGLVSRYHGMRRVEEVPFDQELAVRGAAEQAVVILMAGAVVTALVVPVLVAGARPGLEVIHPMALVTLGGVVTATLGPLLLFPALYLRWGQRRQPDVLDDDLIIPEEANV
jgi:Cu/Ag efflux pump CusA